MIKKETDSTELAYRRVEKLVQKLCLEEDISPIECAGVMMAQAMRIYKTALTEDAYERLIETILETRSDVTPFVKPTTH
jgi:hypothetical protein